MKSNDSIYIRTSKNWVGAEGRLRLQKALERAQKKYPALTFSSVSHTQHIAGFALAKKPVGFDLEPRDRTISTRARLRLGTAQELKMVTNPLYLWVMKEAAYKALRGPLQPKVVTKIRVTRVRKTDRLQEFNFSFKLNNINSLTVGGQGVLRIQGRTILGFALRRP